MKLTLRRYSWLVALQLTLLAADLFFNAFGSWLSQDKLQTAIFFFMWVPRVVRTECVLIEILPYHLQCSRRIHYYWVFAVYIGSTFDLRLPGGRLPHYPTQLQAIFVQHYCLLPAVRLTAFLDYLPVSIATIRIRTAMAFGTLCFDRAAAP